MNYQQDNTMTAISINKIVNVTRIAINSGFNRASLQGNFLSENILVPSDNNRTLQFTNLLSVGNYFGTSSNEYKVATNYFRGYNNSLNKPTSILYSRYVTSDTPAYAFTGLVVAPSKIVADIKALAAPTMTCNINGVVQTLVLTQADFTLATGLSDIVAVLSGALNTQLSGASMSVIPTNLRVLITAPTLGGATSSIGYCIGNVAELLKLTELFAPTLVQGSIGGDVVYNMTKINNHNRNYVGLTYVTRLTGDSQADGFAVSVKLAEWSATQNDSYLPVLWEGGTNPTNIASATSLRAKLVDVGLGTTTAGVTEYNAPFGLEYNSNNTQRINTTTTDECGIYASFILGMGASINYTLTNAKINFAGKSQAGLSTSVTTDDDYDSLVAQGYGIYGDFATRASNYQFTEDGSIGGSYRFYDNFYDAIFIEDTIQNSLATLIQNVPILPYNETGKTMIRASLNNVAIAGLNAGVITTGNTFTPEQIDTMTSLAGVDISTLMTTNGYYVGFGTFTPEARSKREKVQVYFIYTSGGAINSFNVGQVFVS